MYKHTLKAFKIYVGNIIYHKRIAKDLSQSALAEKLNCSIPTISNYENGKTIPSLFDWFNLQTILGISAQEFNYNEFLKIKSFLEKRGDI